MNLKEGWQAKVLIVGVVLGLLTGVGAAYILIQRAQRENSQPEVSAGDGVKLGLGVLGLLRLVSELGDKK